MSVNSGYWMAGGRALAVAAGVVFFWGIAARATNGDILEGIGAVSVGMGGTGVAAPQDGLTAVVNNPAAMPLTPDAEVPEAKLGVTFFQPKVKAKIKTPGGTLAGGSHDPTSFIPYLSYTQPFSERWHGGFAAYGISGMGVDYRDRKWDLDGNSGNGYEGAVYTKFASMKLAPALSYRVTDDFSVGGAFHLNYSALNIGQGNSKDVNAGVALGVAQRLGDWYLGASYTMPQKATFKKVYNFDEFMGDTRSDTLKLEQPAIYHVGLGWEPATDWVVELDVKRIMWGATDGYGDFDWEDQWVYALGAQYRVNHALQLRAGFNYGKNPVRDHHGWNPMGATRVQGKMVPTMGYELLRNVAFPAIVETHASVGFSYLINENLSLNVAYSHAFEKTIKSTSAGGAMSVASSLSEHALGIGVVWAFR